MKVCNRCQESKPPTAFYASDGAPDGLMYTCKECVNSRQVELRRARAAALKFKIASMKDVPCGRP